MDKFKDLGTVVMGKVESGSIREGDSLLVMPNKVLFWVFFYNSEQFVKRKLTVNVKVTYCFSFFFFIFIRCQLKLLPFSVMKIKWGGQDLVKTCEWGCQGLKKRISHRVLFYVVLVCVLVWSLLHTCSFKAPLYCDCKYWLSYQVFIYREL